MIPTSHFAACHIADNISLSEKKASKPYSPSRVQESFKSSATSPGHGKELLYYCLRVKAYLFGPSRVILSILFSIYGAIPLEEEGCHVVKGAVADVIDLQLEQLGI